MSYFGDFQPAELDLVLALPYRIGVWISHIDDVAGTQRDEAKESIALDYVLNRIHDNPENAGFVTSVVHEIDSHKGQWKDWGATADTAMIDLPRALSLVDARLPKMEAQQYRKCIFQIAKTVAMAAHEGPESSADLAKAGFLGKIADWLSAKSGEQIPGNISPAEKDALGQLLQRLKER